MAECWQPIMFCRDNEGMRPMSSRQGFISDFMQDLANAKCVENPIHAEDGQKT